MPEAITKLREFVTQIEDLLRRHNIPAALDKCKETKNYIQLLNGAVSGSES